MRKVLILLFTFLLMAVASAQTIKELEEQRKNALKRLETTSKVLSETKKTQQTSLNKLNIINKSISQRTSLINTINKEINALTREIATLHAETKKLERELEAFKEDYARMVREAYINRGVYSKMLFLLSAESFDQSFRRLRYMQEFTAYRKQQIEKIDKTRQEIAKKTAQLTQHQQTQEVVKKQKNAEQQKLMDDKKKENTAYANLKQKEKNLQADLKKQQQIANDLNRKIEALIAEEVRKAEEQRKKTGTASPDAKPGTGVYTLTKEEQLISGNFAANAGRLLWPVERGFISGKFGVQPHPTLKYVTTNNKGVYIQTPTKTIARAVFEGVVTQRFSVPGSNNGVIIQHGQYRTVYANLTTIYVRVGEKVSAKQRIGQIYTDTENDNKTELFFQIWKERTILNPESWIAK
jgi:septal ring factor EnvC (AmiA/AmiB activator)